MSEPLAIDADAYGKYARASAVADFLELLALRGNESSEPELADLIGDNGWALDDMFLDEGESRPLSGRRDAADEQARVVFSLLEERQQLLGHKWPFRLDKSRLKILRHKPADEPYVALLAILLCHAFDLKTPHLPERVFEATVADVFGGRDLLVSNFGETARKAHNFEKAVMEAGAVLSLEPTPLAAIRKRRAQDENVDTLCRTWWGDVRPGIWCIVGQVTCAVSEEWEGKISEFSTATWGRFLNVAPEPAGFLAVPHHVESLHFAKLVQDHQRVVVDRLRLVTFKAGVLADEKALIEIIVASKVESPW